MKKSIMRFALLCIFLCASASNAGAESNISREDRDVTVRTIAQYISDLYFDEAKAAEISRSLLSAFEDGAFSSITTAEQLADALTGRLVSEDRHFNVRFIGCEAVEQIMSESAASDSNADTDRQAAMRRINYGFSSVEILPGNIGYIEAKRFYPIALSQKVISSALEFVANTDAVIIDVRQNNGGPPGTVQFLISHFLSGDEPTLINTFITRESEHPIQMWSLPSSPSGNRPNTPLVVLTSGRTGSAAEAFAYHLQAMKRATIIGETTGGAGNPGGSYLTDEGFSIFISTAAARNPITRSNWEGVGVVPDIVVPSAQSLERAREYLYQELLKNANSSAQRLSLEWAQELLNNKQNPVLTSEENLRRYVGGFGTRDTYIDHGTLMIARKGAQPSMLRSLGNDRFAYDDDDRYRIVFHFDRGGRLASMDILMVDGSVTTYPAEG